MATQSISSLQATLPLHSLAALSPSAPAASSESIGKAGFDQLAGTASLKTHLPTVRLPLARRLSRTLTSPLPSAEDEHDTPLTTAAAQLVAKLEGKADDGGDPWQGLDDPLQQQTLLDQARQLLDQQAGDGARRPAGRDRLDAMQAELAARHGAAIAQGQRAADALEGALATLDAAPATLSALRQQFGAPASARRDAPMAPAALLDILLAQAGPSGEVLGRPPAQLHAELRRRGRSGPRLWLSMQDAACFQLVNTSVALAGELRRELSAQAHTTPLAGQGALAKLLLGLGDPNAGRAGPLLDQLVDLERLGPRQRGAACLVLRATLARCPDAMWSGAPPSQRLGLLDQLQEMIIEQHAALPALAAAPADVLQARLRRDQYSTRND